MAKVTRNSEHNFIRGINAILVRHWGCLAIRDVRESGRKSSAYAVHKHSLLVGSEQTGALPDTRLGKIRVYQTDDEDVRRIEVVIYRTQMDYSFILTMNINSINWDNMSNSTKHLTWKVCKLFHKEMEVISTRGYQDRLIA